MSTSKNIDNFIEELIQEVEEELEEATTTANIDGYETPYAFSDDEKSKKKKDVSRQAGYSVVGESKFKGMIVQDVIDQIYRELIRKFDVLRLVKDKGLGLSFIIVLERNQRPTPIVKYLRDNYGLKSKVKKTSYGIGIEVHGDSLVETVNEAKKQKYRNRWLELKNDDSKTPHKKLAVGLKELKYQLREVEKFLGWYSKIKSMNELETDNYWKRTNKNIRNIKERIINIAHKLKELEQ